VSSPTFFSILAAWVLARWKRARLVVEIRDLWPAIFVELGVLTNRWAIRVLEALELALYRSADAVVVVSEGFRADLLRRGIETAKVHTIPNGVDLERFAPAPPSVARRARLGAGPDETLVLYIGAHGLSHGLVSMADAAKLLAGDGVHVAFVGEGAAKAALAARVAELGLDNVTMLPGVPRDEVPALVAAADICLVPLRDLPLFHSFIPSKLFELLGAGKAVVGALRGEAAAILSDAGGVVVPPEDASGVAEAVRELAADPARRSAMGRRARAYVADRHDRRRLASRYRDVLRDVVARGPAR
jgi:glycosyltransferase involved in cell wall biosynthesis